MKAISDSTTIIHLSKIRSISLLKKLFDEIIIPKAVYEEVISEGKRLEENEIISIEKLIEEKFIIVKELKNKLEIENLDKGEIECISLCKELNIKTVLMDEKKGFKISLIFDLNPIRTTSLLAVLLDQDIIDLDQYKDLLKKLIESGYFIDTLTYEKLLRIGENINKK